MSTTDSARAEDPVEWLRRNKLRRCERGRGRRHGHTDSDGGRGRHATSASHPGRALTGGGYHLRRIAATDPRRATSSTGSIGCVWLAGITGTFTLLSMRTGLPLQVRLMQTRVYAQGERADTRGRVSRSRRRPTGVADPTRTTGRR